MQRSYSEWKKKTLWRRKEKLDAKEFNGQRTPRSGGLWNKPGDVKSTDFLFDSKFTERTSYSVRTDTLRKIHKEALLSSRTPALSVKLGDGTEFVVLRKDDFISLISN